MLEPEHDENCECWECLDAGDHFGSGYNGDCD